MKVLKLFAVTLLLFFATSMQAQVSVSVNIGTPPMWGPVGYTAVHYYYLPDVEAYYDVQNSMFIYYGGGAWLHRRYLPAQYKNYDLYRGYKVVMTDYHGNTPYTHFKEHKMKYYKGYHGQNQRTIGEHPGQGNPGGNNGHTENHGNEKHDQNGKGNNNQGGHGHDGHDGDHGKKR